MKKILLIIFSLIVLIFPLASSAADYGLIPCDGNAGDPCSFEDVVLLVDNVIDFLIFTLAIPIATIIIMYAGWIFLTKGASPDAIKKAKGMMWNVLIGLSIALAAWLIVEFVLEALGCDSCTQFLG